MVLVSKGHCVACGTLPRDAELRKVGAKQSSVTNFSIKVDEPENKKAVFLKCTCWHKLARYASGLEKGDSVLVAGKLREYSYTNKNTGELVNAKELVCEFVTPQESACEQEYIAPDSEGEQSTESGEDDGDLPF